MAANPPSTFVQMVPPASAGLGGIIQGLFGTYAPASDGSYSVDTRDAASLLARGISYVSQQTDTWTTPVAPATATVGEIVASAALSNGSLTIANQPEVMREVVVVVGAGTVAVTAGNVAVTYVGNGGQSHTDNISAVCAASGTTTQPLSQGAISVTSAVVSGVVGGASPFVELNTTAAISVPLSAGSIDATFLREYDSGATVALGTAVANVLGTITPTNAPNGTRTYTFVYSYVGPVS